jgi:tetratricopeptide (TPR) repeat protein
MSEPGIQQDAAMPAAPGASARPMDLRIAGIHLRMGALDLARAELEAFAGAGSLDPEALLDLAEVRWRTGDLGGAGVAADAYLSSGTEAPIALVIAAEAAAATARYGEARRLAARAVEVAAEDLDALFAGMPRSAVWPEDRYGAMAPAGALFGDEAAARTTAGEAFIGAPLVRDSDEATPEVGPAGRRDAAGQSGLWDGGEPADSLEPQGGGPSETWEPSAGQVPPSGSADADDLAAARAAMAIGDRDEAARQLAELIRRRPELAATILGALPAGSAGDVGADEPAVDREGPGV